MGEQVLRLRDPDLFWREVDDEVVALDGRTWEYLNLNRSGQMLWKKLVAGATSSSLVSTLTDAYGIDPGTAATDVDAFLRLLRERDLLID